MTHEHKIVDSDVFFEINPQTREIVQKSTDTEKLIQYDHNSERFTFTLPRYVENHDMTICNKVQIQYVNVDSFTKEENRDAYTVDDLTIHPDDDSKMTFTWLLSQNATKFSGTLSFSIRFSCVDSEGNIIYVWNTGIFSAIAVDKGMYNQPEIVEPEKDVLEQWKNELILTYTPIELTSDPNDNDPNKAVSAQLFGVISLALDDMSDTLDDLKIRLDNDVPLQISGVRGELIEADGVVLKIAKAYTDEKSCDKDLYGNAIKATENGEVVRVDDVSPIEHTAKVKVNGKNLFDISKVITDNHNQVVNNGDGTITVNTTATSSAVPIQPGALKTFAPNIKPGYVYTLSAISTGTQNYVWLESVNIKWNFGEPLTVTDEMLNSRVFLYASGNSTTATISNIQLELGDTTTEYEPYIDPTTVTVTRYGADESDNPQTFTPSADGTCEITSLSPTMTILTDTPGVTVDLEYNQDASKALENVKTDIKTLDNDMAVLKEKTTVIVKQIGKNMIDPKTFEIGKTFDASGNIVDTTNYSITGYIPVITGETVAYYRKENDIMTESKMRWLITYDADKNKIAQISMSTPYLIPEGVSYIRAAIAVTASNVDSITPMICYKTDYPDYEPYEEYELSTIGTYVEKIYGLNDYLRSYDDSKFKLNIPPIACDSYATNTAYVSEPNSSSLDNVYSLYDALVTSNPDYVTKTLLGTVTHNAVDMPIYRYDFKPPKITSNGMKDVFKVIMTNCIHGNERIIIPVVYRLMKDICENWRTSDLLRTLRYNCHFTVVPIVNPYGFLKKQRVNENGIDLCRNFEIDFTSDLDGADSYPHGTTANSEQSTQIMTALAKSEHFDFLFDMHGYGNYADNANKAGYVVPCLKRKADVAFARCLSLWANSKLLKDNPNITDINVSHFHAPENPKHNGYMSGVFKNGMIFELMSDWNDETLGTAETAQKLNVEILGGAVLTVLKGYKPTHLII